MGTLIGIIWILVLVILFINHVRREGWLDGFTNFISLISSPKVRKPNRQQTQLLLLMSQKLRGSGNTTELQREHIWETEYARTDVSLEGEVRHIYRDKRGFTREDDESIHIFVRIDTNLKRNPRYPRHVMATWKSPLSNLESYLALKKGDQILFNGKLNAYEFGSRSSSSNFTRCVDFEDRQLLKDFDEDDSSFSFLWLQLYDASINVDVSVNRR
jgi:hypothetical protein